MKSPSLVKVSQSSACAERIKLIPGSPSTPARVGKTLRRFQFIFSVEVHIRSTQRPLEMQTWAQVAGGLSESQQHHRGLHPSTLIYVREDLLPQPGQPAPMQVDQGSASRHIAGSIDSTGHSDDAPAVWVAQLAPKDSVAIYRAILTLAAPMASVQKCCSRPQQMEVRSKFAKLAKLRRHHAAQCCRPPWCSSVGCCAPCDPDGPFEVLVCEGPKCMETHYEDRMAWHRGCLPASAALVAASVPSIHDSYAGSA